MGYVVNGFWDPGYVVDDSAAYGREWWKRQRPAEVVRKPKPVAVFVVEEPAPPPNPQEIPSVWAPLALTAKAPMNGIQPRPLPVRATLQVPSMSGEVRPPPPVRSSIAARWR